MTYSLGWRKYMLTLKFCLQVWKGRDEGVLKKRNKQMEEIDDIERGRL